MLESKKTTANAIVIIGLILSLAIFIIDLQTPLGIADGILYIGVLFLFIGASNKRLIILATSIVVILIITGYFISPPTSTIANEYIPITNRLFAIIVVIVCAIIILRYKKSELLFQTNSKNLSEYKYALGESSIIAITDEKGIIIKVNESFCKISKYGEEELIGQNHRLIKSGYHSKEFFQDLWRTIANGKVWRGEIKNKAKDGTFYWVDTSIVPFLDEHNKPYQYLSIRVDITNRKKAEENLIQQTLRLERSNQELTEQITLKEKHAEELIIANKNLIAFTFISSHDLQEPLRKIQTFASILLEQENKNLSENGKHNFERLQLTASRMRQQIEDLLAFSRIPTTELLFENIELNQLVDSIKTELEEDIQKKRATIEFDDLGSAKVISSQFRQLLHSLVNNALKFSRNDQASHIRISSKTEKGNKLNNEKLTPDKNYLHLTVKDNGIGFEPHFNERIFDVFQKLHGKEEYAGTGIGLATAKKIVENHNGFITATSQLNQGATFDIYIPAN